MKLKKWMHVVNNRDSQRIYVNTDTGVCLQTGFAIVNSFYVGCIYVAVGDHLSLIWESPPCETMDLALDFAAIQLDETMKRN